MAKQQTQQRPRQQGQQTGGQQGGGGSVLDASIAATVQKQKQLSASLEGAIDKIESLLPPQWKGHAARFVKRAVLYFGRKPELHECSNASFIQCVLDAAELGLCIDGKLCHAVKYNNKKKGANGREQWVDEAQCMVDYKGLRAVAKRCGAILDIEAKLICENDTIKHSMDDGGNKLHHTWDPKKARGATVGVVGRVWMPGGMWRYDIMSIQEIYEIRSRSKSFKAGGKGPWATDPGEMAKKTLLRRMLKDFQDDPGIAAALELEERDYETTIESLVAETDRQGNVDMRGRSTKSDRLADSLGGNDGYVEADDEPNDGPSDSSDESQDVPQELRDWAKAIAAGADENTEESIALYLQNGEITQEQADWLRGHIPAEA